MPLACVRGNCMNERISRNSMKKANSYVIFFALLVASWHVWELPWLESYFQIHIIGLFRTLSVGVIVFCDWRAFSWSLYGPSDGIKYQPLHIVVVFAVKQACRITATHGIERCRLKVCSCEFRGENGLKRRHDCNQLRIYYHTTLTGRILDFVDRSIGNSAAQMTNPCRCLGCSGRSTIFTAHACSQICSVTIWTKFVASSSVQ